MRIIRISSLAVFACLTFAAPVVAQSSGVAASPILTIESERLFSESLFGKRVAAEIEAEKAVLAAENRRIEAELEEEEKSLTEQRPTLEAETFRKLADAFDEKVQTFRSTQEAKVRALSQREEAEQRAFLQAIAPVLERLVIDNQVAVILEKGTVFYASNAIDITSETLRRIDARIGDGAGLRLNATRPPERAPQPQE